MMISWSEKQTVPTAVYYKIVIILKLNSQLGFVFYDVQEVAVEVEFYKTPYGIRFSHYEKSVCRGVEIKLSTIGLFITSEN